MHRTTFFLAACATLLLAFFVSRDAHALGPMDVEVGAVAGAGTMPTHQGNGAAVAGQEGESLPNVLGFGLGGRAGVAFHGLYAGIEGMYNFGGSTPAQYGAKAHSYMLGADLGYGFRLPFVTIRPLVGIGNFTETVSGLPQSSCFASEGTPAAPCSSPDSRSYNTLYVQPGIAVLVSFGALYVGADANLLVLTSIPQYAGNPPGPSSYNWQELALTFHAQVGERF